LEEKRETFLLDFYGRERRKKFFARRDFTHTTKKNQSREKKNRKSKII